MGSAVPLPLGQIQCIDANGAPYSGGFLYHYIPGTTTPKTTWQDPLEQSANLNPVSLDGAGRATVFGNGEYRQILQDSLGNTIWDKVTIALGSPYIISEIPNFEGDAGIGGESGLVPAPAAGDAAAGRYLSADGTFDSLSVVVPTNPTPSQAGLLFVPIRSMTSTTDALLLTDSAGAVIYKNAGEGTLTITQDATAGWVTGVITQIMIVNPSTSGILTLAQDSNVSLTWPGNSSAPASRMLAPNGQVLLSRIGNDAWTVVGSGLS